jgi:hypothetical protein
MSRWCDSKLPRTFLYQKWRVSLEIQRAFHRHVHWSYREKGRSVSHRYWREKFFKWVQSLTIPEDLRGGPNKVFGKQQGAVQSKWASDVELEDQKCAWTYY